MDRLYPDDLPAWIDAFGNAVAGSPCPIRATSSLAQKSVKVGEGPWRYTLEDMVHGALVEGRRAPEVRAGGALGQPPAADHRERHRAAHRRQAPALRADHRDLHAGALGVPRQPAPLGVGLAHATARHRHVLGRGGHRRPPRAGPGRLLRHRPGVALLRLPPVRRAARDAVGVAAAVPPASLRVQLAPGGRHRAGRLRRGRDPHAPRRAAEGAAPGCRRAGARGRAAAPAAARRVEEGAGAPGGGSPRSWRLADHAGAAPTGRAATAAARQQLALRQLHPVLVPVDGGHAPHQQPRALGLRLVALRPRGGEDRREVLLLPVPAHALARHLPLRPGPARPLLARARASRHVLQASQGRRRVRRRGASHEPRGGRDALVRHRLPGARRLGLGVLPSHLADPLPRRLVPAPQADRARVRVPGRRAGIPPAHGHPHPGAGAPAVRQGAGDPRRGPRRRADRREALAPARRRRPDPRAASGSP